MSKDYTKLAKSVKVELLKQLKTEVCDNCQQIIETKIKGMNIDGDNWPGRIITLCEKYDLKGYQLADKIGITPEALSRLISGKTKNPKFQTKTRLEKLEKGETWITRKNS